MKRPDLSDGLGSGLLTVPRVQTKPGEAAFSFYARHMWNKLTENLRPAPTLISFKAGFKTFLFATAIRLSLGLYLSCTAL